MLIKGINFILSPSLCAVLLDILNIDELLAIFALTGLYVCNIYPSFLKYFKEHTKSNFFVYLIHHTIKIVCLVCVACGGACVRVYYIYTTPQYKGFKRTLPKVVRLCAYLPFDTANIRRLF